MGDQTLYRVGTRVRMCCALPSAPDGAEGSITRVIYDKDDQVVALEILVDSDPATIHGISAYPHEITLLDSDDASHPGE